MFNGLSMSLGNLACLSDAQTRSISAENPTGAPGAGAMAQPRPDGAARDMGPGWKAHPCIFIDPGKTATIADIDGPGAIQSMWIAGFVGPEFIIRIYWDGCETPSVEAPLPAFFAYAFGQTENTSTGSFPTLSSLPVVVAPRRGLNFFWEMPFRTHCRITIENRHQRTSHFCFYQINYTLTDVPEDKGYFCAQYRQARPVDFMKEYLLADISGRGHYIGTALAVGLNGAGGWWGEGEIKFYLDGDGEHPSICGTGTEDYFGGAFNWDVDGKYTTYSTPYLGMYHFGNSDGLYNPQQRFQLYRWHVMDPIRFRDGLRATLQDLGWRSYDRYLARRDDFISVAYWYSETPSVALPPLPSADECEII